MQMRFICLVAVACVWEVSSALAQPIPVQDQDKWDFRVGLPFWASGTSGTFGIGGREVHVNDSFTDLLDTLDFAVALNLEIRKRGWLFFSDGTYIKTSTSGQPGGLFGGAQVSLDEKLALNDLALGYAVVKHERFSVEPFAGAQLTYLNPKLSLEAPVPDRVASTTKFWADPIIGVYLHYNLCERVRLYAKSDVGGFDISSRLTYQAEGGFDVPLGRKWYARLAYHYLDIDYEKGTVLCNIAMHGPQLELGLRF